MVGRDKMRVDDFFTAILLKLSAIIYLKFGERFKL